MVETASRQCTTIVVAALWRAPWICRCFVLVRCGKPVHTPTLTTASTAGIDWQRRQARQCVVVGP